MDFIHGEGAFSLLPIMLHGVGSSSYSSRRRLSLAEVDVAGDDRDFSSAVIPAT